MTEESPERKLKAEMHDLVKSMNRDSNEKQQIHIQIEQFSATELDTLFEQIKQMVQTPRDQSEQISEGKIEPQHLGEKTPEVLQQELFSLMNTKPPFRDKEWQVKWESVNEQINNIKDARVKRRLKDKARAMRDGEQ